MFFFLFRLRRFASSSSSPSREHNSTSLRRGRGSAARRGGGITLSRKSRKVLFLLTPSDTSSLSLQKNSKRQFSRQGQARAQGRQGRQGRRGRRGSQGRQGEQQQCLIMKRERSCLFFVLRSFVKTALSDQPTTNLSFPPSNFFRPKQVHKVKAGKADEAGEALKAPKGPKVRFDRCFGSSERAGRREKRRGSDQYNDNIKSEIQQNTIFLASSLFRKSKFARILINMKLRVPLVQKGSLY